MKKIDLSKKQPKKYAELELTVLDIYNKAKMINITLTLEELYKIMNALENNPTLESMAADIREALNIDDTIDDSTTLLIMETIKEEVEKTQNIPRGAFGMHNPAANLRR